jgi:hypothetical protein
VPEPIVAILVVPELHTPPLVLLSTPVVPGHSPLPNGPVIAVGKGFTVNTAVAIQPVGRVYIIVSIPAVIPLTTPVAEPIVAFVLLTLHTPPPVASLRVAVPPGHTDSVPVIHAGSGFSVSFCPAVWLLSPLPEQFVTQR